MRRILIAILLSSQLIGCQSAKIFKLPVTAPMYDRTALVQPATVISPTLSAELPLDKEAAITRKAEISTDIKQTSSAILPPDTTLKQPPVMPTITDFEVDPATTVVNAVGGAVALTGAVLMINGALSDPPQTEWGGLTHAMQGLTGFVLFGLGIALLFFQGERGRHRLLKQTLKTGGVPTPSPPTPKELRPKEHTNAKKMISVSTLVAVVLLSTAIMIYVPYTILLIFPLAIVGLLVLLIANIAKKT